jgi:YidC/Oxa1 family membrane protein insertase
MDKKNTTIGIILLALAVGLFVWNDRQARTFEAERARQAQEQIAQAATAPAAAAPQTRSEQEIIAAPVVRNDAPEQISVLENDLLRVEFTTHGGAIKSATFKSYPAVQGGEERYSFNKEATYPAMAIDTWDGGRVSPQVNTFSVASKSDTKIVFRREVAPGVIMERSYEINLEKEGAAPYTIRHTTALINQSGTGYTQTPLFIDLGVSTPDMADSYGYNLNAGYYNGDSFIYERISYFQGGGFIFHSDPKSHVEWTDNIVWATTKNQFFANIVTPARPAQRVLARPIQLPPEASGKAVQGLSTAIGFDIPTIAAGGRADLTMDCYIGPKEYRRLSHLTDNQDKVMQFGWSKPFGFLGNFVGFVGKLFYTGLVAVQGLVVNWGVAIIMMTILIRLLFWPLTAKAAESSRKMARLQKPLKEVQEKYKDDPKKRNEATLELWKKHKINPLAGCLPVLIQVPIFIAFYYMLRGASELRFAHFLWIGDLSLPDTITTIYGFPLNIMPLLMGVSMFYQMHLAPSPSTDPMQAKIMKFMPLIFLFFCYNFSSGLVLYWTISNCMSILQQLHTNHKRDQEEAAEAASGNPLVDKSAPKKKSKKK